jgi:hypothetical protein
MRRFLREFKTWAASGLAVLLIVLYRFVGDRCMVGEWLAIWPPVLWGSLLALRCVMLLFEKKHKAALVTASLGFLLTVSETETCSLFRREDTSARQRFEEARKQRIADGACALRIVSWNVAGGAPLYEIEALDPDICFFQEIGDVQSAMVQSPHWRAYNWLGSFDPGTLGRYALTRLETERVGP